jgi:CubicO group peptidase (beta-lactamase class C family)
VNGIPGTLWGVFQANRRCRVITLEAAGRTDGTTGEPCTPDTVFQAASVSKQFVAASLMLLSEREALGVSDPVLKWWPAAPPEWGSMKVCHLLEHSSGLPHWADIPGFSITRPPAPDDILDQVTQLPLTPILASRSEASQVSLRSP